jgi:hypothetical protein
MKRVANPVEQKEKNNESIDEAEIEDEYKNESGENDTDSIYNKSVISSNIMSHINTPKLFSNVKNDMSYCSSYARSEYSRTDTLYNENDYRVSIRLYSANKSNDVVGSKAFFSYSKELNRFYRIRSDKRSTIYFKIG